MHVVQFPPGLGNQVGRGEFHRIEGEATASKLQFSHCWLLQLSKFRPQRTLCGPHVLHPFCQGRPIL